jgi:copper chaperone NosL
MKRILPVIVLLLVAAVLPGIAHSEPMDIPEGSKCHVCGMKVDPASPFSAQIVRDGEMLTFCDIGDMLHYYNKQKEKPVELYVRDSGSGEWTDALKATYVKSKEFETPMGWGIAAFADSEEAARSGEPMTFEEALNAI